MDRLGLLSIFGVCRWRNNWVLRSGDLVVDRNGWTMVIRDTRESRVILSQELVTKIN